jgi:hypothetical protein
MSSSLPALSEPREDARRWRPASLGRAARRSDLVYVIVDDIMENSVTLVLSTWPEVDRDGRLRFAGKPVSLGADRGAMERYLAKHRRPRANRDRPLRIGDVFALRVQAGAFDEITRELEEQRRLEPFLDPEQWIVPPVYDVTADARDEAKVAFYAAVTSLFTVEQADVFRKLEHPDGAPSARLARSRRWLRDHAQPLGATTVLVVGGLAGMFVLGRVTAEPALPPPPEQIVTVTSGPGITPSSFASFTFSGAGSYECRIDEQGTFENCPSPFERRRLSEGEHALEVRAQGGTTATTYPWAIVVPPEVEITNARDITRPEADVTFTFAATSDGADTFQCRLDDTLFSRCASDQSQRYDASQLPPGPHSFEVRAVERSVPGRAAIHTWLVRGPEQEPLAGPIVRIESAPGITTSFSAKFTFSGAPRYECRLDATGTFDECPPAFSDLNLGPHILEVRGLDTNGKRGSITTYPWTIVALPSVTITAAPEPTVFEDESVSFEFSSDDEGATFLCRFDDGDFVSCESGTTYPPLNAGIHTFEVLALARGLVGEPALHVLDIENVVE